MCLMLTCSDRGKSHTWEEKLSFLHEAYEGMTCTIARPLVSSYCWNVVVYVNYVKITCVSSLGR